MSTSENLQAAFAGESQANRRYLFFAEKADEAGQSQIARLFRAAAEAEAVHARNHLRNLHKPGPKVSTKLAQGIGSTRDNLLAAISGEHHEFTEMYPGLIAQALAEGEYKARDSFDLASKVERIHHGLYEAAVAVLDRGEEVKLQPFYVCQACGNTVEGEPPETCPVCGAPKRMFKLID